MTQQRVDSKAVEMYRSQVMFPLLFSSLKPTLIGEIVTDEFWRRYLNRETRMV